MIERGHLKVNNIQTIILDEAIKMLDMGFEESISDIYNKLLKVLNIKIIFKFVFFLPLLKIG